MESGLSALAPAANKLVELLTSAANILIEPARIRSVAQAKAEETRILTDAEIRQKQDLAAASYRLQAIELIREANLRRIGEMAAARTNPEKTITDADWLGRFIEDCKDTSDAVLQEVWAKLLAGELDAAGSCSKRTIQLVKGLSRAEASLIKEACRQVCVVEDADGDCTPYLNVIIRRIEPVFGQNFPNDEPKKITLFEDPTPGFRKRNRQLIDCGFLSNDDFKFTFSGEGRLTPEEFGLSPNSARNIRFGATRVTAAPLQPGLLFELPHVDSPRPRMRHSSADIEFDVWRLTPEGAQLHILLKEEFAQELEPQIRKALEFGGLSLL